MAAPYVVRNSGLRMPIRDHGPSIPLAEVIEWRRGLTELLSRCTVSWTAEGFNRIRRMSEAEKKRYQAMGPL